MRGCEIRELRWRDIDFTDRSLVIRRSKTLAGERMIPLNANAHRAIMRLRERAQKEFGAVLQSDWYVFPSAEGYSKPDPKKTDERLAVSVAEFYPCRDLSHLRRSTKPC